MRRASPASEQRFRVGILGAGFIAGYHLHVLSTLRAARLVSICDARPGQAATVARSWGLQRGTSSLTEMLERDKPHVVHVLLPAPDHAAAIAECLAAGCHVLVEKPAALSGAACRQLAALARRSGRTVGVNHNALFHPAFRRLVEITRARRLGEIQHVTRCWNVPLYQLESHQYGHWMFLAPGNVILEQAIHPLSQIQFLLGDPRKISALNSGRRDLPSGTTFYDTWQASLLCDRGTADCLLGFSKGFNDDWLHVVGQDGAAFLDLRRNTLQLSGKTSFVEPVDDLMHGLRTATGLGRQSLQNAYFFLAALLRLRSRADPFYVGMRQSIAAFYDALLHGQQPPVTLDGAAIVVESCETIVHRGLDCPVQTAHPETHGAGSKLVGKHGG